VSFAFTVTLATGSAFIGRLGAGIARGWSSSSGDAASDRSAAPKHTQIRNPTTRQPSHNRDVQDISRLLPAR
jgi:hypothetical protein